MLNKTSDACEALECVQPLSALEEIPCSYTNEEDISPNMTKTVLIQNHKVQKGTLITDDILNLL